MTAQLPSKVRLAQIASFSKSMALPPSHDEIEAMARFALAAHEQEPVEYATHVVDDGVGEFSDRMNFSLPVGTKLYTQSAPVPAVPDEMEDNGNPHDEEDMAYVRGWNACRAAMLNGGKS